MSAVAPLLTTSGAPDPAPAPAPAERRSVRDAMLLFDGSDADERIANAADCVATAFGTHLEAVLVNEISLPQVYVAEPLAVQPYEVLQLDEEAADRTAGILTQRLERTGHTFELRRIEAFRVELEASLASLACSVDLVVTARPYDGTVRTADLLEAVLFGSGTPALVVPPQRSAIDLEAPVVVGWKNTPECFRAVQGALPFLQRASLVHLVTVEENPSGEEVGREPSADIARHLARHGVRLEVRHLPRWEHPAKALLNEVDITGAGLLVTGAYGRSRLREWFLGGVTRELLEEAHVPTLLAH
ncbi:universal stress protein [Aureimonas sp. D3]|uniref:universal stress protein n=1 Tax=Aureimonas sp. D3 TaxID=1638164 RepID=UPI000ABDE25C|nr:universal stress protein [Aureimonas sp. D3]